MKIVGIDTHVLTGRLEGRAFGWSQRVTSTRQAALCVISTDAGFEGLGEAFYFGGPATVVATLMRDGFGRLLVGCDPMDTSVIWDTLYNWTRDHGQKGLTISALSAVDIALWDIKRFEFDTLKAAAGLEEDDLIEALETARQSQILVDVDSSGGGSFEFSHNLICTVIIELTSSPRRRRLHQQAIRALEEIQPNEYGILAWHCREAGEALRSAIYFRKAAERAIQAYAHEDALRFCSESLSLSAQDPAEYMPDTFAARKSL